MTQLPAWVNKINAIWLSLGAFLTVLALQGVSVPESLTGFFSDAVFQSLVQAGTAVFTAYQLLRTVLGFVKPNTGIKTLDSGAVRSYAFNPFKITP